MTLKVTESWLCNRCGKEFNRRVGDSTKIGWFPRRRKWLEIGWFRLTRGSGSKTTEPGRERRDLDKDLCEPCTDSFFAWWKNPEK